mgnify:CR=1 FL=1
MKFGELNAVAQHKDFGVFNSAELVVGIAAPGCASYTRKEIDALIDWVKRPQVGASGMVYVKCEEDGTFKSSVDKFYDQSDLKNGPKPQTPKPVILSWYYPVTRIKPEPNFQPCAWKSPHV